MRHRGGPFCHVVCGRALASAGAAAVMRPMLAERAPRAFRKEPEGGESVVDMELEFPLAPRGAEQEFGPPVE